MAAIIFSPIRSCSLYFLSVLPGASSIARHLNSMSMSKHIETQCSTASTLGALPGWQHNNTLALSPFITFPPICHAPSHTAATWFLFYILPNMKKNSQGPLTSEHCELQALRCVVVNSLFKIDWLLCTKTYATLGRLHFLSKLRWMYITFF